VAAASATGERHLSTTPFVGRDRELGLLEATWERVERERRPHLITVLGPSGVGKSRLTAEFTERISARGGRVVRGRCLPYRERSAYGAFAMQVKELAGIFDSDDVDLATGKCATLVERLVGRDEPQSVWATSRSCSASRRRPPRPTATASSSPSASSSRRAPGTRPTTFVFEDIHWADPALLDLIEQFARACTTFPFCS
jgi:predicted ATPase